VDLATDPTPPDAPAPTADPPRRALPLAPLVAAAITAAALAASYLPSLIELARKWSADPNYSHGYFIIPIALGLLWMRADRLDPAAVRPRWYGWAALVAVLAVRAWAYDRNELLIEQATLVPAVAALVVAFGGWGLLKWAWPSVFYLLFMLPLPSTFNTMLAAPLQRLATIASGAVLQATGLPVLAEGNILYVGPHTLEVARACNGLSMMLTFVALITAVVFVVDRPIWEKVVLFLSAVPIALVSNVLRIAVTAWAYHGLGPQAKVFGRTVDELAHDAAGLAMMPVALLLVGAEMWVLSKLVVEEEEPDRPLIYSPPPGVAFPSPKKA